MILQALTQLFEDLAEQDKVNRPGWSPAKIHWALCLDEDGNLTQLIPTLQEAKKGKKSILIPQIMNLPAIERTSDIRPKFLWDHAGYLLGMDVSEKTERTHKCFQACKELHQQLLGGLDSPVAKAIVAFYTKWNPADARNHPAVQEHWKEFGKRPNLVWRVGGIYAQDVPEIRSAWERYRSGAKGETAQCLVTGRQDVPQATHPSIKGVKGAQSSGAALVSFNHPADCSYGKKQNLNAPVGEYAAFAYTTALNHLLSDRENVHCIENTAPGNSPLAASNGTTVVCWAEGAEPAYNGWFNFCAFGDVQPEPITTQQLHSIMDKFAQGRPCDEIPLDLSRRFYILGLAPNSGRLSVRFFYNSTFGELMQHVAEHHKRLEITGRRFNVMPLWALMKETVNRNTKDPTSSPAMAGAVARSIFSGTAYPASLMEAVMLRIRAERDITPGRAAILKAYYLKNQNELCPEEALTVSLNETSTNIPYTLGRLFAVYEAVQEAANPEINATIKDRYFHSASATPAMIFPILDQLAQKHLRKLKIPQKVFFDQQIGQLKCILGETNPIRMSLPEQGSFYLGYYHQKQQRYTKKEEK